LQLGWEVRDRGGKLRQVKFVVFPKRLVESEEKEEEK
jgi:hypothetical protein